MLHCTIMFKVWDPNEVAVYDAITVEWGCSDVGLHSPEKGLFVFMEGVIRKYVKDTITCLKTQTQFIRYMATFHAREIDVYNFIVMWFCAML